MIYALANFSSMKFQERECVQKRIIIGIFKLKVLVCFTCRRKYMLVNSKQGKSRLRKIEGINKITEEAPILRGQALDDRLFTSSLGGLVLIQSSFGVIKSFLQIFDTSSFCLGLLSLCFSLASVKFSFLASRFTLLQF